MYLIDFFFNIFEKAKSDYSIKVFSCSSNTFTFLHFENQNQLNFSSISQTSPSHHDSCLSCQGWPSLPRVEGGHHARLGGGDQEGRRGGEQGGGGEGAHVEPLEHPDRPVLLCQVRILSCLAHEQGPEELHAPHLCPFQVERDCRGGRQGAGGLEVLRSGGGGRPLGQRGGGREVGHSEESCSGGEGLGSVEERVLDEDR